MNKLDRHGCKDILLEGWANLQFDKSNDEPEIQGCSFNCLLNGAFTLNGFREDLKALPGGILCWDTILDSCYITLSSIATIHELIARVRVCVYVFLAKHRNCAEETFDNESNRLFGALVFLFTWIASFNAYISDSQLTILRAGIIELGNLGMRQIRSNCRAYNNPDTRTNTTCCGELFRSLENLISTVSYERSRALLGVSNTWHTPIFSHMPCHRLLLPQPSISQLEGNWNNTAVTLRREARGRLADTQAAVTVDLFGGGNLANYFDSEDDDDDDEDGDNGNDNKIHNSAKQQDMKKDMIILDQVRVGAGVSLLRSPSSADVDLWSFEILEIARQLTLIDHAMFCNISLHSLLVPRWSDPRHVVLCSDGGRGSALVRTFIDRFNALSIWATTCVLRENSLQTRARRYSSLVSLSGHLLELGNYNSAMAVMTALQQGCVNRLKLTLSMVSKTDKDRLADMQRRLSPVKSYAAYKQEMRVRVRDLADNSDLNGAIVPHFGAHLAELAAVHEGNQDYILENTHLINIHKKIMIARCLSELHTIQQLSYSTLQPVRLISALLNRTVRAYMRLTAAENTDISKKLFERSMSVEPPPAPALLVRAREDDDEEADEDDDDYEEEDGDEEEEEEEADEEDEDDENEDNDDGEEGNDEDENIPVDNSLRGKMMRMLSFNKA